MLLQKLELNRDLQWVKNSKKSAKINKNKIMGIKTNQTTSNKISFILYIQD